MDIKKELRKRLLAENEEAQLKYIEGVIQKYDCAVITAFRDKMVNCPNAEDDETPLSDADNKARNQALANQLGNYTSLNVDGVYVENYGTEEAVQVKEDSFFVINDGQSNNFFADMAGLGAEFCQDAVLMIPKGGQNAYLVGTNNADWPGMGNTEQVGAYKRGSAEFMTTFNGEPFHFG